MSTRTVSPEDIGSPLGPRATLLQISSAFCMPCRAARVVLSSLAEERAGIVHVDVDAESHLELVRRLDVQATPTTFVLDASGTVIGRLAGVPKRTTTTDLLEAIDEARPYHGQVSHDARR